MTQTTLHNGAMSEDAQLPAGFTIGPYQVQHLLGEGGMGQVYLARHDALRRQVAVKVLAAHLARDEHLVRRFFNEALAVNVVRHPGLVEVFDAGQLGDGRAYLVMEYLRGQPLRVLLERGRLPLPQALSLCQQIAEALAAAHAQGIVHRDLKPDNLMLLGDARGAVGAESRIKVLDFGVAKVAAAHQRQLVQTAEGAVIGTPAYMAPEQWMSSAGVDDRADVYALGVILYRMLAGVDPFVADNPSQYMFQHLYEEPAPLSTHRPDLPTAVTGLVARLLSKTRAARPAMAELCESLRTLCQARLPEFEGEATVALPREDPPFAQARDGAEAPNVTGAPYVTVPDSAVDLLDDVDLSPRPLRRLWARLRAWLKGR